MKRSFALWQLFGFAVVSLLGTLLHFLYEWTGESPWAAPFSGVNESTWEHMKLLFWPMLLFAAVEWFFFEDNKGHFSIKLRGILIGITLIPLLFYTYNGVIGPSPDFVNISIFFIAGAVAFIYETHLFYRENANYCSQRKAISIILIIALLFILFTFRTPNLAIFKDPTTGQIGI